MSQLALARPLLQRKEKEKKRKTIFKTKRKRKRKEILNNDLAVLPSHDIAFLWYSANLQWTENTLCHRYYFGLPDRIQDIISTHERGRPSTFQTLYSTAISINNHF